MIPAQVIRKKRDGRELDAEELRAFIEGILDGSVMEAQAAAFLMATLFRGMTESETATLTRVMLESGKTFSYPEIKLPKIDKHSTGGIGDKVSLILGPLAACLDLAVPMMAGRGLGHTGGTIDKLESIPGFKTTLDETQCSALLREIGIFIVGQSEKVAPADRVLYALRDVTGTVESIPLIVGSILSKKLAAGTDGLVLDVKVGQGAFMKTLSDAQALAHGLVHTGALLGLPVRALLTRMDDPLGATVGNRNETYECLQILRNPNSKKETYTDLIELTLTLAAEMALAGGHETQFESAYKRAQIALESGAALERFEKMVSLQGGDLAAFEALAKKPARAERVWTAPRESADLEILSESIGYAGIELGAGRKTRADVLDLDAGFEFFRKSGAPVSKGEPIVRVTAASDALLDKVWPMLDRALLLKDEPLPQKPLILDRMNS